MWGMQVLGLSTRRSHADKALPSRPHVLHGSRVMECLFESSPDYAGVTGLFTVAMTAHEGATTAAVIISFASGSRALTAGGDGRVPTIYASTFSLTGTCTMLCRVRLSLVFGASQSSWAAKASQPLPPPQILPISAADIT